MKSNANWTWTEHTVMSLIRQHFVGNAYVVLSQVRNQTGYGPRTRTADAIVMSLWPSRGLTLSGFEIKVTRSDWKSELDEPEKAEEISRFCDRWYVAAPPGVVELEELPPTWGLYEVGEKKLKMRREAVLAKEAQPISRGFLAALLRAATAGAVPNDEIRATVERQVKEQTDRQKSWALDSIPEVAELRRKLHNFESAHNSLKNRIEQFEASSGIVLDTYRSGQIGKAVLAIQSRQPDSLASELENQAVAFRQASETAAEAAKQLRAAPVIGTSAPHPLAGLG